MKIAFLSNHNINLMKNLFSKTNHIFVPPGFNTLIQNIKDPCIELKEFDPDECFILIDVFDLINNNTKKSSIKLIDDFFDDLIKYSLIVKKLILCTVDCYPYNRVAPNNFYYISEYWNEKIDLAVNSNSNIYKFDLQKLILDFGRNSAYSLNTWYTMSCKYSFDFMCKLVHKIETFIDLFQTVPKKCLVLDLDNTLWGGVVGELGMDNVELSNGGIGRAFKDFQTIIKDIESSGVVLAIISKNNEKDALDVISMNRNMVLKSNDFVIKKINWKPKNENMTEIIDRLNINEDSVVFIDDSKFERELMKEYFPNMIVPEFVQQTYELPIFGKMLYEKYFTKRKLTEEDEKKTEVYLDNLKRHDLKEKTKSIDEFLLQLNMKTKIWFINSFDTDRVSQLTMKTNQFNLMTKRYSTDEIIELSKSKENYCFVFSSEDRFGDNGKVGVVILKKVCEGVIIDTFLMSCRVMGRRIEYAVLASIENYLFEQGIQKIESYYSKTERNMPCKNFYNECGYKIIGKDSDTVKYRKKLYTRNDIDVYLNQIQVIKKSKKND